VTSELKEEVAHTDWSFILYWSMSKNYRLEIPA